MSTHMSTQERRPFWRSLVEHFTSPAVPDLWIVRKYVVIIVLGVSVWALYVAIGRVCVPAIHSRADSAFTRGAGIGILVPYLILWLMFVWAYVTVCSPVRQMLIKDYRHASGVIPVSEDPAEKSSANGMGSFPPAPWNVEGPTDLTHEWGHDLPMSFSGASTGQATMGPILGAREQLPSSTAPSPTSAAPTSAPPGTLAANSCQTLTGSSSQRRADPSPALTKVQRPVPGVSTQPRWCKYCKIVKPDRTHHCRHCGTCVLQFDHHCLWIGRCVGWKNHAIFVTFCFWAGMLCLFNFIVLVVDTSLTTEIDGQKVALIAICGFLFVFTLLMMLPTHVYLITAGRSTVESFQTGDQNRAEEAALKLAFDNPICPTKEVRAVKKSWEAEYGGVAVNDRWRFSDRKRDLWKQQMGKRWTGWIFPVGRPEGDGVHFPANPRFGPNGEWLPVRDWPKVVAI